MTLVLMYALQPMFFLLIFFKTNPLYFQQCQFPQAQRTAKEIKLQMTDKIRHKERERQTLLWFSELSEGRIKTEY